MKRFFALLLILSMILSLAACSAVQKLTSGNDTAEDPAGSVSGETYDAGRISVLVPDGWNAVGQHDVFSDDPNAMLADVINVCKGGATADDLLSKPHIRFDFGGTDKTLFMADKDFYDDVEELQPLTTGAHTWNGFSCDNYGSKMTLLFCDESPIEYQASIFTETSGGKISLDDADVLAILASVAPTGAEDAAAAGTAEPAQNAPSDEQDLSELYARFRGDWHGMVGFRSCDGQYASVDGADYPAIARFKVDSDGEIHPFVAVYVEGAPFQDLSAEWDDTYGGMRLSGSWQTSDFEDVLISENNGTLSLEIPVSNQLGNTILVLNFRHLDDTGWTDEAPRLNDTTIERCMGMSFDDLAEMFDIPYTDYPSEDNG